MKLIQGLEKALGGIKGKKATGKVAKKVVIISIIIVVMIVVMLMMILQHLFQYIFCIFTVNLGKMCDASEKHQKITDEKIIEIAKTMKDIRADSNDGADVAGEYYLYIYPGMATGGPGGSYMGACGPYTGKNAELINKYAQKYSLDPQLVAAFAKQESGINHYKPDGVTVVKNAWSGATGMMQLMPATAKWLGVDPMDIEQNVDGGAKYIKMMLDERNGDMKLALASYNWGPGNVNKALKRHNTSTWDGIVSNGGGNSETNKYVVEVMKHYEEFKRVGSDCSESSGGQTIIYAKSIDDQLTAAVLDKHLKGSLSGLGKYFVEKGKMYEISPAFLAAVAKHETKNGTTAISKAPWYNLGSFKCASDKNKERFGITCANLGGKSYSKFKSYEKGIEYGTWLISTAYIDKNNAKTLAEVQKAYCPDKEEGCDGWSSGVNTYMTEIYSDIKQEEGAEEAAPGKNDAPTDELPSDTGKKISDGALDMWKKYGRVNNPSKPILYEFGAGRGDLIQSLRGDCSAFTMYVASKYAGAKINATAASQGNSGKTIFDRTKLQAGDLVIFKPKKPNSGYQGGKWTDPEGATHKISHVGIYVGNGEYVHLHGPSVSGEGIAGAGTISKDKVSGDYFTKNFVAGVRVGQTGVEGTATGAAALAEENGEGIQESELHLRVLMQVDYFAFGTIDLSTKTDPKTGKKETGIQRLEEGSLKNTNVGKTWAIVKETNFPGIDKKWSTRDKILYTRAAVYQCYFVGEKTSWFVFTTDTCKSVNKAVEKHYGKDYIPSIHQGVLTKTHEETYTMGEETYTRTVITHPSLKKILMDFKPYSLAEEGKTLSEKDGTYEEWVEFYLSQLYSQYGVSGDYRSGATAPNLVGDGTTVHPVAPDLINITSPFGPRTDPKTGLPAMHLGVDYGAPRATPIYAVADGLVEEVRSGPTAASGFGNMIRIKHNIENKMAGGSLVVDATYAHLLDDKRDCINCLWQDVFTKKVEEYYDANYKIQVTKGQKVEKGQLIAYMGSSGKSTGYHLHFQMCTNGYSNCFDPLTVLGKK